MATGIYCIKNIFNNKTYIGQANNIAKRKREHFSCLKANKHPNSHLQKSFNKYGKSNFVFKTLIICEYYELTYYEQSIINLYNPTNLYNIRLECVDSNLGIKHSEQTKLKLSEKLSGKNHPMYGKRGKDHYNFGKIRSDEFKENLSVKNSGKLHPMYGKPVKSSTKILMSKAKIGKKRKAFTKETIEKMSLAALKREEKKRNEKNNKK